MREAIGGTWIFQIVVFFVLLFTGFMCLSINHSKAFNVKNNIVKEIERQEQVNDTAIANIVEYLQKAGYRTTGRCPDEYNGYNRDGQIDSRNSAFCIAPVQARGGADMPNMQYYKVIVFYQLDLPIFRSVFNFSVSGDTKILSHSNTGGLRR